jgi:hypothetical protein
MNILMAVTRERWHGGAIQYDGTVNEQGKWLTTLLQTLKDLHWTSLKRDVPVALILSNADEQFALASSYEESLPPLASEYVLGNFADENSSGRCLLDRETSGREYRHWSSAIEKALSFAQIPYDVHGPDLDPDRLRSYKALVVPSVKRMERTLWNTLRNLRQKGKKNPRIIYGPHEPLADEFDTAYTPEERKAPHGAGKLRPESHGDLKTLAGDLGAALGELSAYWIAPEGSLVECSAYRDQDNVRVLIVTNCENENKEINLSLPRGSILVDPFTNQRIHEKNEGAPIPLAPWESRFFVVS